MTIFKLKNIVQYVNTQHHKNNKPSQLKLPTAHVKCHNKYQQMIVLRDWELHHKKDQKVGPILNLFRCRLSLNSNWMMKLVACSKSWRSRVVLRVNNSNLVSRINLCSIERNAQNILSLWIQRWHSKCLLLILTKSKKSIRFVELNETN